MQLILWQVSVSYEPLSLQLQTLLSLELKSCDGRVGSLIKLNNGEHIVVVSPNVNVIYAPLLGKRSVRMRQGHHFAADDPMYYPQPYVHDIGYL